MEELELQIRIASVTVWLLLAFVGYMLYSHRYFRYGKICLCISLLALAGMALDPWTLPKSNASPTSPMSPTSIPTSPKFPQAASNQAKIGEVYIQLDSIHKPIDSRYRSKATPPVSFPTWPE